MKSFSPTLYIFSGLPATGKTTLALELAKLTKAMLLRIDTVEQALRDLCSVEVQGEGYRLSYRLAEDNLKLGLSVVADSCNPVAITRREWNQAAINAKADFINIEIICSDKTEHEKRALSRKSNITGLILPSWDDIKTREYHSWDSDRIVIDTAGKSVANCMTELLQNINK